MTLFSKSGGKYTARDCISGRIIDLDDYFNAGGEGGSYQGAGSDIPYAGPGLVDIQVNGVNGVDFNDVSLSEEGLLSATGYLLSRGVTTFFPTVITNSPENIRIILSVIDSACNKHPVLEQTIGGVHLEGPFLSDVKGYRGAHNKRYVLAPDWEVFYSFQKASGNRIRVVTLAPELDGAVDFIKKCTKDGLVVGIAHSNADTAQVNAAVEAGATLSTHIGNSVPVMLPRHPNIIWDQLAEERLYASIIADGFHVPGAFIKTVLKVKGERVILISDSTNFSGLSPGVYESHIGREVVLEEGGRLSMKGKEGLLAGSSRILPENIRYLLDNKLTDLSTAWRMGSEAPSKLLGLSSGATVNGGYADMVIFRISNGKIIVAEVFKKGKRVWKSNQI